MESNDFNIIYAYTRMQALADGVLVNVSEQAKETGFKIPVALSDHLYNGYVVPPANLEGQRQSVKGRLHDVLMMTLYAARERFDGSRIYFDVLFLMGKGPSFETVKCVAIVGPGDSGEPVMTICLPEDE